MKETLLISPSMAGPTLCSLPWRDRAKELDM
jgi:hypothetical protein